MNALLVDGSPTMRAIQRATLADAGVTRLREAASADAALDAARQEPPDLVLADWACPGVRARGFLDALRALAPGAGVLAIVAPHDDARAGEHADARLHKPITPGALRRRLDDLAGPSAGRAA